MYIALPRSSLVSVARRQSSPFDLLQRLAPTTTRSINTASHLARSSTVSTSARTASIRSLSTSPIASHKMSSQILDLCQKSKSWGDSFRSTKPELHGHLSKMQTPKVLWVGCCDSRVPETEVCDANPGDFFVTRNIANQFRLDDDNALSVLTFAVQAVGIEHVVVVGHNMCGGVIASIGGIDAPPSKEALESSALLRHLVPLFEVAKKTKEANPTLEGEALAEKVVYESVKLQVENIVSTNIIQDNWKGVQSPLSGKVMNKVQVHGLYYDIKKAELIDLDLTKSAN